MNENQFKLNDIITLFLSLSALIIPLVIFFLTSPEDVSAQALIIFGIIVIVLFLGLFGFYFYSKWRNIIRSVNEIRNSLKEKKLYDDMDVRLRVVESLLKVNRKGQIDPRIIFWIILIILIFLFLRAVGIF